MKILLINDTTSHENWGAKATPAALRGMLSDVMPRCEVEFLPNEWLHRDYRVLLPSVAGGPTYRRGAVPHLQWLLDRLSRPRSFFPAVADDFETVADAWARGEGGPPGEEFLRMASDADAVVYNAENSIYRNTKEGCRGIFLLWYAKTRLGRIAAAINQTAHVTGVRPVMRAMIQLTYPALDLVTAREPASLRCLHELGVTGSRLVPDPVFALGPGGEPSEDYRRWRNREGLEKRGYFCLSASGLPVSRPQGSWDGTLVPLVRRLKQVVPTAVLIAKDPHCRFLEDVARRTDAVYFGPEHSFHDLWPLFRGARFVVSGHYHYGVIAASVGCPFVPLTANNHKMAGLCELLGIDGVGPHDITFLKRAADDIVAEALAAVNGRDDVSARLTRRSEELCKSALENATALRDLLLTRQADRGAVDAY